MSSHILPKKRCRSEKNNEHGIKGRRRCKRCDKKHVGCVSDSTDGPCQRCLREIPESANLECKMLSAPDRLKIKRQVQIANPPPFQLHVTVKAAESATMITYPTESIQSSGPSHASMYRTYQGPISSNVNSGHSSMENSFWRYSGISHFSHDSGHLFPSGNITSLEDLPDECHVKDPLNTAYEIGNNVAYNLNLSAFRRPADGEENDIERTRKYLAVSRSSPIIPLPLPTTDDDMTPNDGYFLRKVIHSLKKHQVGIYLHPIGYYGPVVTVAFQFGPRWPSFPFASKAFRYFTLAYCTSHFNIGKKYRIQTQMYLEKAQKPMQDSINENEYMEVFVAAYAALMCYTQLENTLSPILTHAQGLFEAGMLLLKKGEEDVDKINKLLMSSLDTLRLAYFVSRNPFEVFDHRLFDKLHQTIEKIVKWICTPSSPKPIVQDFTNSYERFVKMWVCLKFRLDYYLIVIRYSESDEERREAISPLRDMLLLILELVPTMLNMKKYFDICLRMPFDWPWLTGGFWFEIPKNSFISHPVSTILYTYVLAWVLWDKIVQEPHAAVNSEDLKAISSGQLLCRFWALDISQSDPKRVPQSSVRYLFWAGIGLKNEEHDVRDWICRVLTLCQDRLNRDTFNHDLYFKALRKALGLAALYEDCRDLFKLEKADVLSCNRIGEKLAFPYRGTTSLPIVEP